MQVINKRGQYNPLKGYNYVGYGNAKYKQNGMKGHNRVRIYRTLCNGESSLLSNLPDNIKDKILVSYIDQNSKHNFAVFKDYIELYKTINAFRNDKTLVPSFNEIINFDVHPYVKPFFDIDIDNKQLNLDKVELEEYGNNVIKHVLQNIYNLLGVDYSKILLFKSHREKGNLKRSYHIVVTSVKVKSCLMKNLYKELTKDLPKFITQHIDHSIYTNNSQFRILGACKFNEPIRDKQWVFNKDFDFGDEELNDILRGKSKDTKYLSCELFMRSLVTNTYYTDDKSQMFLNICDEKIPISKNKNKSDYNASKIVKPERLLPLIPNNKNNNCFKISGIQGALILLKRLRPSKCNLCQRTHDHENAYLYVNKLGHVYFNCRRNNKLTCICALTNPK